jgi:hypothetical protein
MTGSIAKLKSNDDKASPCCRPFLAGNLPDKCLPIRTLRQVSFKHILMLTHVKWVPCHHGMARPQVANAGHGLQIWRVADNSLNNLSRTADKGWSSSLGVGLKLLTVKKLVCYEMS